MDFALLLKHVNVVFREIWQRKFLCLLLFAAISFVVLIAGMMKPSKFVVSATLFADNQNILKPLLQNQAAITNVQNQTKVVKDMIGSPRILKKVVDDIYGSNNFDSAKEVGQKINELRAKIKVKGLGNNYIKVSYSDSSASEAYRIINSVVDVFIKASSEEQRSESREAFLFIDNQVKQYKDQLVLAEERLKDFRSFNFDGGRQDVDGSIRKLRGQLEELKIGLDEDKTTIKALKNQLKDEPEFSSKKFKADIFAERLEVLETQLSQMLLTYTEDYPDVVSLRYQIDDIKKTMREVAEEKGRKSRKSSSIHEEDLVVNPLYQELRSRLSVVKTDVKAKENRLVALNGLLEKEYDRRKRIAERAAEEAELTRDYNVTKKIYEDMLERKEKARLSMTLNIEGQGVTYRIQDPALPPVSPVGIRFFHFVVMGPILGLLGVVGLMVALVLIDPRVRFPERLNDMQTPLLAVVPHITTPFSKRVRRVDMIICLILGALIMGAYIGLAYASKIGVI